MVKKAHARILAADGLRGLAILAIILFHLRPTPLQGGFLGVSTFFVLSGFFITTSVDKRLEGGSFHYGRYLLHRITRLWPPVMGSIALSVVLSALFAPEYLPKMARDGWASSVLLSNLWMIVTKIPYFASAGLPSPLKPLWFVALIMQFYVVWTLVLWGLRTLFSSERAVLRVTLALILASTVEMGALYNPADPGRVYYALDTRFAELLAGSALAMVWEMTGGVGRWRVSSRIVRDDSGRVRSVPGKLEREAWVRPQTRMWLDALGWVCLALLVVGCFLADGTMTWMYEGGFLIAALLSSGVLAAALAGGSLSHVLSFKPLRHVGSLAYSLYLVHFPVFEVMNRAASLQEPGFWQLVGQVVVAALAGEAFYQLVERGTSLAAPQWQRACTRIVALAGCVAVLALTLVPASRWQGYASNRRMKSIAADIQRDKTRGRTAGAPVRRREEVGPPARRMDENKRGVPSPAVSQSARGGGLPQAAKVPDGLNPGRWTWDARKSQCDVRALIIGDSVSLGAKEDVSQTFPNAIMDSQVGRQFTTAVGLYREHTAKGLKPDVLVISLGANGPIASEGDVSKIMAVTRGVPVFFTTVRGPMTWTDHNNALLRQSVDGLKGAGLLDWSNLSAGHPEYFYADGTHLTPGPSGGRQAWSRMLRRALCGV